MPIYAYRCATCGHAQDVLQKMSDPVLGICPACGAATYVKQVTAAGFQLKGSGWYVTDFRGDKKSSKSADAEGKGDGGGKPDKSGDKSGDKPDKGDAKAAPASSAEASGSDGAKKAAETTPAAASPSPSSAPAPAPSPPPPASGKTGT